MISAKYNKALINREFITELANETASDIYEVQTNIAKSHANSGKLYRYLQQKPFTLSNSGFGMRLAMSYPVRIRYMDMKKDPKTGKKKKNYQPIYNKIVWGFIYGYLYKQLMYGVSQQMNQAIINRLESSGFKLK